MRIARPLTTPVSGLFSFFVRTPPVFGIGTSEGDNHNLLPRVQSMPDATIATETLRRLHRIHLQLRDLQERLDRGPRLVQAHNQNLAKLETVTAEIDVKVKSLKISLDDKQLQLKTREIAVERRKQQLIEAKSNKEYKALQEQIAADEEANGVLEGEVLEAMERLDALNDDMARARAALAKAREEAQKSQQEFDRRSPLIQGDVERLQRELREGESELPSDFRDVYSRLVRQKGPEALAPVGGEFCGGCNQHIPLYIIDGVKLGKPSFCKSCGRLLYLPEGSEGLV